MLHLLIKVGSDYIWVIDTEGWVEIERENEINAHSKRKSILISSEKY